MKSRRSLLQTGVAILSLTLAAPSAVQADEPIPVVATFSILGDMVARIGGEHIALTTLVGPDGDAHVYQPTPSDARAVADAEVLIVNGLEFEGWLDRLIDASGFDGTRVVATDGIDPIPFEEEGHDEHGDDDHGDDDHAHGEDDHEEHAHNEHGHDKDGHDEHGHDEHAHDDHGHDEHAHGEEKHAEKEGHDHGHDEHAHDEHGHDDHEEHAEGDHHGHHHGAFDPHAWQSLDHAVNYVDNITAALAKADPANAAAFYENRAAYVAELESLEAEIRQTLSALPEDRRTVVTSHDAFGYFEDSYGLSFHAPQGLSTSSEPSAADVAAMIRQIREEKISAVFVENITDNRLLEQIASETGAKIGGTLYSDALSGPDGPAATYIDMMRHNAAALAEALGS
ncbi:MAG: zinc ABC transporter substrate-binding protein [Pseudomonadota bacterium]